MTTTEELTTTEAVDGPQIDETAPQAEAPQQEAHTEQNGEETPQAETPAKPEVIEFASISNDILARLAQKKGPRIDEHTVTFEGKTYSVYARKLSYAASVKTASKRIKQDRMGRPIADEEFAAVVGYAWQIHNCIVANIAEGEFEEGGEASAPVWMPLYSVEQLAGEGGLMHSENPEVCNLLYQLLGAVWKTNPELAPVG